jgi:hypothetical protein
LTNVGVPLLFDRQVCSAIKKLSDNLFQSAVTPLREDGEILILGKKKKAAVSAALVVPSWFFN